jgi:DNA-binding protein HU-beta
MTFFNFFPLRPMGYLQERLPMKKSELITHIAELTNVSQQNTRNILDNYIDTILDTLKREKRFAISGLGVFHVVKRAKRTCRNPQTGEPIKVKAHNAIKFKPSRNVKNNLA